MIRHPKTFALGLGLAVTFVIVFVYMFTPNFGGMNAFHASDKMFNSIAKGSTYYIPDARTKAEAMRGHDVKAAVLEKQADLVESAGLIAAKAGMSVTTSGPGLVLEGDLGMLLERAVEDSDAMFYNRGQVLEDRYSMDAKIAQYVWWNMLTSLETSLKLQKNFKEAKAVADVVAKAVEVGYNFYGIQPDDVSDRAGILTFALIFYVVYTMWWGYAIFFMSDGIGMKMTKGKKTEA